jgi:hypothetical protein
MSAVSQVVILNNVLDAHELLFCRRYLFQEGIVVPMCLVAATGNLVVIVSMLRNQYSDDLVGDQVFPICAGDGRAVGQHDLC